MHAGRPDGAQPQPRQLLRRDRAGRVLHGAHRARHRLHQRSAARGPHPLLRRHADLAARRAELPRDPDQRAGRAGAQQPARRHAPAGDPPRPRVATSRTRSAAAVRSRPGAAGFTSFPEPMDAEDDKVRGKAERFAEHYTQATLFWNSQTPVEKAHIVRAFRFELTRVQVPAVRERVVSCSRTSTRSWRSAWREGLGMRDARAAAARRSQTSRRSPRSSSRRRCRSFARPGDGSIRTRRVAILVADGVDGDVADGARTRPHRGRRGAALRRCARSARVHASDGRSDRGRGDARDDARRCCSTRSSSRTARGGRRARARTAGRSSSSRTSTATASRSSRSARR